MESSAYTNIPTSSPLVTLGAFHGILWAGVAICSIAFALRLYIRYHCFQRLLVDDWIMSFALVLLISVAALAQAFLGDLYDINDIENGKALPDANIANTMQHGLRGFGSALVLSLVGILAVKINFLLFFKRLGTQITSYLILWYIVLFITIACGVVVLGMFDYKCVFNTFEYTMTQCAQRNVIKRYMDFQLASVILDAVSDLFIICFPVIILWKVRISLRKKIILSCTFGLVALTIAVTIVRGSVFGGVYKSFDKNETRNLNMSWMWFWIFIEFAVAFLIACIISFRALFAQREAKAYKQQAELREAARQQGHQSSESNRLRGIRLMRRARYLHDSILDTFKSLETVDRVQLPELELGRFSATFITKTGDSNAATSMEESVVSVPQDKSWHKASTTV